jgi:transcriptional regulator with XRE-family HTH domain
MFRQLIRQLRLAKGLTLEQVAQALGVTRASVSKWEGGHSRPDQARLQAIADLFEVSAAHLLGLASANPPKEYTVIELTHGVPIESLLNFRADVESYPSSCNVSENAYFVRLDNDTLGGWGLGGVPPGSLLLVDPERAPHSGDVVMTRRGSANYAFMGVNIVEGVPYCSYLNEKYARMAPTRNPKIVGVVVEAVKVTPMLGYLNKLFPKS